MVVSRIKYGIFAKFYRANYENIMVHCVKIMVICEKIMVLRNYYGKLRKFYGVWIFSRIPQIIKNIKENCEKIMMRREIFPVYLKISIKKTSIFVLYTSQNAKI